MIGKFPEALNFNQLFLELGLFICNYLPVLPRHRYTHNYKYQLHCKFTDPYQIPPFPQFTHSHSFIYIYIYICDRVHFVYSTACASKVRNDLENVTISWRTDSSNRVVGSSPIFFVYTTLHIRKIFKCDSVVWQAGTMHLQYFIYFTDPLGFSLILLIRYVHN